MKAFRSGWSQTLQRAFQIIQREGVSGVAARLAGVGSELLFLRTYKRWIAQYDMLDDAARKAVEQDIAKLRSRLKISIIVPACGARWQWLATTIDSVRKQLYPHWELWICLDHTVSRELREQLTMSARSNDRIRIEWIAGPATWADNANAALARVSGDFIVPVDPGDMLAQDALYWVAKELAGHPEADLIFSDEDALDSKGARSDPWFKPDWNPALMLSCNAFGRLGVYRRALVERVGGFRGAFAGAEEHELILRATRAIQAKSMRHIARVLYHRRRRSPAEPLWQNVNSGEAGRRALEEHLAGQGIAAQVRRDGSGYQVAYATPSPQPLVSIIIATTARPDIAEPCLRSLFERTTYRNFEVLALIDESALAVPERLALLDRFRREPRLRIIKYSNQPFNYSWVNNLGAVQARGNILCFLNDDTEVITADWLEHLVARVSLPQVAAAAPTLYYPDGTFQHAGVILGLRGIAGHACHRAARGSRGYFGRAVFEQDVSCVTAACMMIRADAFRAVGGFDEGMPLAYNDVDLCLRLRAEGWRILWTPAVELVHREWASLGRHDTGPRAEQFARDLDLMRRRWGPKLRADPFYNLNLSLERAFRLAFPPRQFGDGS